MRLNRSAVSAELIDAAVIEVERYWSGRQLGRFKRERALRIIATRLIINIELPLPRWIRKFIHPVIRRYLIQRMVNKAMDWIGELVDEAARRLFPRRFQPNEEPIIKEFR